MLISPTLTASNFSDLHCACWFQKADLLPDRVSLYFRFLPDWIGLHLFTKALGNAELQSFSERAADRPKFGLAASE